MIIIIKVHLRQSFQCAAMRHLFQQTFFLQSSIIKC